MKCYICAEKGIDTDAVGVCIVCGMGVCMEHAYMEEVEFWEAQSLQSDTVSGTFGGEVKKKVPKILCPYCRIRLTGKEALGDPGLPSG